MSASTLAARYEQLRDDVLSGMALTVRRWGLHLLLTRGLTAWMHAWADMDRAASSELPPPVMPRTDDGVANAPDGAERDSSGRTPAPSAGSTAVSPPMQVQKQITSLVVDLILNRTSLTA